MTSAIQDFLDDQVPGNVLSYLNMKKPFFGIPHAYCRWYRENPEYHDWFLFKLVYTQISMLDVRY